MKKIYANMSLFGVLLCLGTLKLNAQISGVVTVNSAAVTGGTNYQTFSALASALSTNGVNGPLTVNVVASSGPYTEQPNFTNITGTSATNTITVNGNGNLLTFNSTNSSQPWVLGVGGADYMYFNNLNVQGTGSNAYACMLSGGANNNVFTACTFSVPANGTSTNQIPVVLSGSSSSFASYGNSGNNNTWNGCTMYGGAYGVSMYGNSSSPYTTGNKILSCLITDWYSRGIYHYFYQKNYVIKGNTLQRPNRTTSTTTYAIYTYYNDGTLVEGNRIQRLFDSHLGSTSTTYGIYMYYNNGGGGKSNPNIIRNNIVSDIKHNGTIYAIAGFYIDGYIYHNTVSLDNAASTSGSCYGIYSYSQSGYEIDIKNNNVSITRGGSGTKYGFYSAGITGNITLDKNNYYVNSPGGTNYVGYYTSAATTLANLQSQGVDLNSFSTNPLFTNPAVLNYIPTSATINNVGAPVGVFSDIDQFARSGTNPDIGAHEFLSVACVTTPSANAVSPGSYTLCPGDNVNLGLANYYSDLGITYQWQSSTTSSVGPFTAIAGANANQYTTPGLSTTTWYSVVMTCTNGNGNIAPVGQVNVAGTTTSTVPYYESFEGINGVNKYPNCSWTSNSLGTNCLTYVNALNQNRSARTGNKYGAFYGYYVTGTNYFYTNGIQLNAGVTYSASLWYKTEYYGYTNFTDLSILLGTSQSSTGLVTIASTGGPAASLVYKSLSNTFTVASSGIYYVAVAATANNSYGAYYMSWDDLEIIVPCALNSPTVALSASSQTVCKGESVSLTAVGADDYSWSNGGTGSSISDNPTVNTNYIAIGTNTTSGCADTVSTMIVVNPSPVVYAYTNKPSICQGQSAVISAYGANSYTWSNSSSGGAITVSPNTTTTYSVFGSNSFNCTGMGVQQVVVNPNPTVSISSNAPDPNQMCVGETITLTGNGALTYQWAANTLFIQAAQAIVTPQSSTTYTLTGTDVNGCAGITSIALNVSECTGINQLTGTSSGVKVYPNPTAGVFTVELNSKAVKTIEVTDLTGRIIMTYSSNNELVNVDINTLANGIYYVKVQSDAHVDVIKVVKN